MMTLRANGITYGKVVALIHTNYTLPPFFKFHTGATTQRSFPASASAASDLSVRCDDVCLSWQLNQLGTLSFEPRILAQDWSKY